MNPYHIPNLALAATLLTLLATGCAQKSSSPPQSGSGLNTASSTSFSFDHPPALLAPAPFTVTLPRAVTSQPSSVQVDFAMPSMTMPDTIVTAMSDGHGAYHGTVTLTMAGKWTASVAVTRSGEIVDSLFPFNL